MNIDQLMENMMKVKRCSNHVYGIHSGAQHSFPTEYIRTRLLRYDVLCLPCS